MKKLIISILTLNILISFVSAQTTTFNFINSSSSSTKFQLHSESNKNKNFKLMNKFSTSTENKLVLKELKNNKEKMHQKTKQSFESSKYKSCVEQKIKDLTAVMRTKKKEALDSYRQLIKNSTSTKFLKESYSTKIREIDQWFNEEVKKIKDECRVNTLMPSLATTTSTSTTSSIKGF